MIFHGQNERNVDCVKRKSNQIYHIIRQYAIFLSIISL